MPIRDYPFHRYNFYDRKDVAAALAPSYSFQPQRGSWRISGIVRFTKDANCVFFVSFGQKAGRSRIRRGGVWEWNCALAISAGTRASVADDPGAHSTRLAPERHPPVFAHQNRRSHKHLVR